MFTLYINPSQYRKWKIVLEPSTGGELPPVYVYAFTFQDALHDWWQGEADNFPHDVAIEFSGALGGVLTFWIEDDMLTVWDCSDEDDPDLISAADLLERRKVERENRRKRNIRSNS